MHYKIIWGLTLILSSLYSAETNALPIGFGYNQGDLSFMELESPNFRIYHDSRTPDEARLTLQSLEAAKPHLERWLSVKRDSPLIVNMSAASDNASFANFVTDSIELQTLGQGGRDLAWHEYTHSTMYRHLDNWFGPAGAIIHLPWMEAWFLEGLAEAISVSIGSDEQAGVERFQALTNNWPTWDRIHSLYTSGPFNYRGYATSGAFVAWILRTHDADKLPEALKQFKAKSMPWHWPWALTPFSGFLPMDDSLQLMTNERGKELYEKYKKAAATYWKSRTKVPLLASALPTKTLLRSPWLWSFENGKLIEKTTANDVVGILEAKSGTTRAWVSDFSRGANDRRLRVGLRRDEDKKIRWIKRDKSTYIDGIWISYSKVWWLETNTQTTQLCHAPIDTFKPDSVKCRLKTTMPYHLRLLGHQQDPALKVTSVLWLAKDHEQISGDQHELIEVQLATGVERTVSFNFGGRPLSMAFAGNSRWLLTADRSLRYIARLEQNDRCGELLELADFPVRIIGSTEDRPHVITYTADGYGASYVDPKIIPGKPCKPLSARTSPLLEAIRSNKALTLSEAIKASDVWSEETHSKTEQISTPSKNQIAAEESSDRLAPTSKPVTWRGRPVFAFPWIGADDPLGPQIGVISVPLMDELQNETVRLTMLYGAASRFPYQELTIYTNRFAPTWSTSAFRAQVYNGRYKRRSDGQIYSSYLEESGGRIDGFYSQNWKHLSLDYSWGVKGSHLKPYIGSARRIGHLNELYGSLSINTANTGKLYAGASIKSRAASPGINKVFQYDTVGVTAATGALIGSGKLELGLEGSRTRGPKRRDLQEMYTPLKTLIPGSGAGYNQSNFALTEDYGLFSPVFGESQARAKLLATYPLIKDIDKFISILYMDRLDISGFYNYGTAWRNKDFPDAKDLIGAHGYNVDLFLDNKGVHFNLGMGIGQVIQQPWQAYWTFGFDALF